MELEHVKDRIELLIRSGYSCIGLISQEEDRSSDIIFEVAEKLNRRLYTWTMTEGWKYENDVIDIDSETYLTDDDDKVKRMRFPVDAMDEIQKHARGRELILILKDMQDYFQERKVVRKLVDLINMNERWTVILIMPAVNFPGLLEKEVALVEIPLPDRDELKSLLLDRLKKLVDIHGSYRVKTDLVDKVVNNSLGLTRKQALQVFDMSVANDAEFTHEDLEVILEQKRQIIAKSGVLEFCRHHENLKHVGGLDNLKEWLAIRENTFSEKAREYGLPDPKGFLLLGVQGCGKSLVAKAVSAFWNIPLLRLDVGALFSSYMGKTEENIRLALSVAESISPAVLWIDEIEKAFSGLESSSRSDAGTTARMFGTFLTWMQEKNKPVFVVATANSISSLPPELIRKGRFDEIFFVDLPIEKERDEIFRIHIKKRKRDPEKYDISKLVEVSEGYSGAEIEEAIVSAMYKAFPEDREFTTDDIREAIQETVPLSRTMGEQIDSLRMWAQQRARLATKRGK